MALRTVAARVDGDLYQGMFFWYQAAPLLAEKSCFARVVLEHDEAAAVDDIAVYYHEPGVRDGANFCTVDFYQVKYHVDRRDDYSAAAMIDPSFVGRTKSILARFYHAYVALIPAHGWFRLHLVSNWRWKPDDPLASAVREADGALPPEFFLAGKKSDLGAIREAWRAHLGCDEQTFVNFAHRLRFGFDYLGRQQWSWSWS